MGRERERGREGGRGGLAKEEERGRGEREGGEGGAGEAEEARGVGWRRGAPLPGRVGARPPCVVPIPGGVVSLPGGVVPLPGAMAQVFYVYM